MSEHFDMQAEASAPKLTGFRRWLRRGPWEMFSIALIALGVVMLMQPLSLTLYTYSFVTTLAGTALFTIVSKFPE
jgi:hypothetical protein